MAALNFYDKKESRLENLREVTEAANVVIDSIDEAALAQHFGLKHDDEDAESCKVSKYGLLS